MTIDNKKAILKAVQNILYTIDSEQWEAQRHKNLEDTLMLETVIIDHIKDDKLTELWITNLNKATNREIESLAEWLSIVDEDKE